MKKKEQKKSRHCPIVQKLFSVFSMIVLMLMVCTNAFSQDAVVIFSESFDNATTEQPWSPYFSRGWLREEQIDLETITGHGKVFEINHPQDSVGSGSGIGNYRIPLDSAYKEVYASWEYYIPGNFDYGYSDGSGGGKFFLGLAGGQQANIPHIPNVDSDGWVTMFLFRNGIYSTYNYFKSTTYDQDGWPNGNTVYNLVKGQWRRITMRLKINDPTQANGILEVFDNDSLVYQETDVQAINTVNPDYLIEHIYLNNFWGGTGVNYKCPQNQYFRFDNIIVFYYPPGSDDYRSGASESGRTITVPTAGSVHPVPPNKFSEEEYTEASGTIESHCEFYQPVIHEGFQTSTIQVSGASSISITVNKFNCDPTMTTETKKQTLIIYEGTGAGKTWKKTFQYGTYTTVPTTINISGSSATIEWQAGSSQHNGFSSTYTSNGSGSGSNFECADFIAHQVGIGDPTSYYLDVDINGIGNVTPGSGSYPIDTTLSLYASTSEPGYIFDGWSGDTTATTNPLSVMMWKNKNITATFTDTTSSTSDTIVMINCSHTGFTESGWVSFIGSVASPVDLGDGVTLTISGAGLASNNVGETSTIMPYNVGVTCAYMSNSNNNDTYFNISGLETGETYAFDFFSSRDDASASGDRTTTFTIGGTSVSVNPVGNSDSLLTITNVAPDGSGEVDITMSKIDGQYGYINAIIIRKTSGSTPVTYSLSTSVSGNGSVSPSSGNFTADTTIMVTATPDAGWEFSGWSIDTTATTNPLPLHMWKNMSITATFIEESNPSSDTIVMINCSHTGFTESGWVSFVGSVASPVNLGDGMTLTISGAGLASNSVGETSTIMPYNVGVTCAYMSNSNNNDTYLNISGLETGETYAFDFFSSRDDASASGDRTTTFTIGGSSVSINPVGNSDSLLTIANVAPDGSGEVDITMSKIDGQYGYINAIIIRKTSESTPVTYSLSTSVSGSGSVSPSSGNFTADTTIMVTATHNAGWEFSGWSGDTTATTNPLPLYMWKNMSITATFTEESNPSSDTIVMINCSHTGFTESSWVSFVGSVASPVNLGDGMTLTISGAGMASNNIGEPSTIMPYNVGVTCAYMSNSNNNDTYLNISGLETGETYAFDFFSSRDDASASGDRTTTFTIGGSSVSINPVGNSDSLLTISNVSPDAYGEVDITMSKIDGQYGYINAIIIRKTSEERIAKINIEPDGNTFQKSDIQYYPIPVTDYLYLKNLSKDSRVFVYNILGTKVKEVNNGELADLRIGMTSLKSGIYLIKVVDQMSSINENIRIVKE